MLNSEPLLAFVVNPTSEESTLMLTAYNAALSKGLQAKWMSCNSLTDDNVDLSFYYVVDSFNGPEFERLLKDTTKIYSAHCINTCLKLKKLMPRKNMPIHNIAFSGITACCTSIEKSERLEIHDLITKMGGIITLDLTPNVTHLIAGEIGSTKYEVARDRKIPVMLRKWVHEVWKINQKSHMYATDEFFDQYQCPIFKGCTICVTGIDSNERQKIKQLVTENGGKYSGELNMRTCTHLIATDNRSQKFKHAQLWKINCVLPEWFYDCINAGSWLNEDPYKINDSAVSDLSNVDNRKSLISASFSTSRLSVDHKRSSFSSKAAEVAKKSKENIPRESLSAFDKSTNNEHQIDIKRLKSVNVDEIPMTALDTCFDGLTLYISGFTSKITQLIYRLINSGGGMRFNELNESVTHVIAGDLFGKKELTFLSTSEHRPFIVNLQWLCDSCNSGKLMDENDYSLVEDGDEHKMFDDALPSQHNNLEEGKNASSRRLIDNEIDDGDESDNLLEQYMDEQNDNNDDEIIINAFHNNDIHANDSPDNQVFDDKSVTDKDEDIIEDIEEEPDGIFAHLKFSISGLENNFEQIETTIKSHSGTIVSRNESQYIIVPLRHDVDVSLKSNMVTLCWLEQSIDQGQFIDPSTDFLYQPFCLPENNKLLKKCVVSISQYSGLEKQHLVHLLTMLGALVQELFARKATKKIKTNTHLIVRDPEGSKYNAANKWNIPCVRKEWIYACADQGSLLPCDDFIVSSTSSKPIPYQRKTIEVAHTQNSHVKAASTPSLTIKRKPALELSKSFLPAFDVSDTMTALQSPASSSQRKSRGSFPLGSMFEENIQIALSRTEKGIGLKARNEKPTKLSGNPLNGLKIAIPGIPNNRNLFQIAKELGADTSYGFEKSCTHLIIEDNTTDTRDATLAKSLGRFIVYPDWLYKCKTENFRVPEEEFSLSLKTKDNEANEKLDHSESVSSDVANEVVSIDANSAANDGATTVTSDATALQKQLEALMEVTKTTRSSATRSLRSVSNSSSGGANDERSGLRSNRRQRSLSQYNCGEAENKVEAGSEPSQNDVVTYDDPAGRKERQKILAQLKSESEKPAGNLDKEPDEDNEITFKPKDVQIKNTILEGAPLPSHASTPPLNPIKQRKTKSSIMPEAIDLIQKSASKKQKKKFIMTALTAEEKTEYAALIERFDGIFLDAMYFQPQCTHMIIGAPNRNEKFYASVAAGKWILHKSYFEASREADQFVNEEPHEWGNESKPSKLSAAAKRWRLKLKNIREENGDSNSGAFDGWKVLLCVDKSKQPGFKRLLEAGNAKVLGARPPFETIQGATHAFIDPSKAKPGTLDLSQLINENISILKPEYIGEYLIQDPLPSMEQFQLAEIKNGESPEYNTSHTKRKSNARDSVPTKRIKR